MCNTKFGVYKEEKYWQNFVTSFMGKIAVTLLEKFMAELQEEMKQFSTKFLDKTEKFKQHLEQWSNETICSLIVFLEFCEFFKCSVFFKQLQNKKY